MSSSNDYAQTEDLNIFAQNLIPETPPFLEKTASKKTLLEDPDAPAIAVYKAAEKLISGKIVNWEPETIWADAEDKHIEIPEENRNKILMISSLKMQEPLIFSAHVFKNIVLTFNNELPNVEIPEEALPEQIAWAVECLSLLDPTRNYYFDYEPVYYTALVLHRDGYFLAPKNLEFAQGSLDKLNKNVEVKDELAQALKKSESDMSDLEREQYWKMERVTRYVAHRKEELTKAEMLNNG